MNRNSEMFVDAQIGMRVLHRASRVVGTISKVMPDGIALAGPSGERQFRFYPNGFIVDGKIVSLRRAMVQAAPEGPRFTTSGSIVDPAEGIAREAKASKLWVEGVHDAELIERVWGDDLRSMGVVVERTDGIDNLAELVDAFGPGPNRKLGLLVDHLIPGSKEQRVTDPIVERHLGYVMVTGTPFIDVWQGIRPKLLGIAAWPDIPRGVDWKTGICEAFGVAVPGMLWKKILASVKTYADLEPELVKAVELLLDHLAG